MTLSPERRIRDRETALRTMASDVGDAALFERHWPLSDPRFKDLASTTWAELQEKHLVTSSPIKNEIRYHLTEAGWVAGLRLNGTLDDPAFRERCISLVKWFKQQLVDGRHDQTAARVHHRASIRKGIRAASSLQYHSMSAALCWNIFVSIGQLSDDDALTVLLGVVAAQELYDDPMWPECRFVMSQLESMPHPFTALNTKVFVSDTLVNPAPRSNRSQNDTTFSSRQQY